MKRATLVLAAMTVAVFLACAGAGENKSPPPQADAELTAEREQFIKKLISRGLVKELKSQGESRELWVTPAFLGLDFDTKQNFANACFAHSFSLGRDVQASQVPLHWILHIYHRKTGKMIGTFSPNLGLSLD